MKPLVGDVWRIDLNDSRGHEQGGDRPAIIMAAVIGMYIVIPLTKQIKVLQYPHTYLIEPSSDNGLANSSVAMPFQIVSLDAKRMLKKMGILTDLEMNILKALIIDMLSLSLY